MFRWEKALSTLDVPADAVLHLFRSMRDVQLALPGLPAQEASAYLCQYATPRGVGTVAAFHLHKSNQLAFYLEAPHEVATDQAEAKLDQALVFVESMGFLLTNLDIQLLGAADRELLWSALPLQQGVQGGAAGAQGEAPPVRQPARRLTAKPATPAATTLPVTAAKSSAVTNAPPETNPQRETIRQTVSPGAADEQEQQAQANVDELLAAVEELRTRRSGLHARRPPPGPEELQRRRLELRESLGCVLASL
jgi:hypothetical protein